MKKVRQKMKDEEEDLTMLLPVSLQVRRERFTVVL
jgi:hypothetical protein